MDYVSNWLLGTPADPTDELNELLRNYQDNKEEVKTSIQSIRETVDGLSRMSLNLPSDNKQESSKPKDIHFAIKPSRAPDKKIESQVIDYIGKTIDNKKFKVHVDFNWEKRKENVPLVVFCNNASRIGADIEYALTGVQEPKVVLIVLHYWRRAVLRGDLSDDDYLLSEELRRRVAFIVHFAFDDEVYDCQQNRTAREMLCSKLEQLVLQKT